MSGCRGGSAESVRSRAGAVTAGLFWMVQKELDVCAKDQQDTGIKYFLGPARMKAVTICACLALAACSGSSAPTATPTNSPPVITSVLAVSVNEGTAGVFYRATATDTDGDAINFTLASPNSDPSIDPFLMTADGSLQFNGPPDFEALVPGAVPPRSTMSTSSFPMARSRRPPAYASHWSTSPMSTRTLWFQAPIPTRLMLPL